MDFFFKYFELKSPQSENRSEVEVRFKMRWDRFRALKSPLCSCFLDFSIEYANFFGEAIIWDDVKNGTSHMFLNEDKFNKQSLDAVSRGQLPPEVEILYYIYSRSSPGQDQGLELSDSYLSTLKEKLGDSHPGVRTLEIQDEISIGNLRPQFARELRDLADRNFEMAFPIALEYSRQTKAWEDVAYYAYLCLKNDVYGLQKQTGTFLGSHSSRYFDYLFSLFEGLIQTDVQAAGTLYEFVSASPKTTRQNLWLIRVGGILNGVNYDKEAAKKAGQELAKKGFYENPKLEARNREYFENRLKKNPKLN